MRQDTKLRFLVHGQTLLSVRAASIASTLIVICAWVYSYYEEKHYRWTTVSASRG